jgi:5-enolpyruvylshikimate-3-phosphate synthase
MFRNKTFLDVPKAYTMRLLIAALLATASMLSPLSTMAQSVDVEATIKSVDVNKLSLTLDDGKTYKVPEEFNFDGLASGVKVVVFYTVVDGHRVVDDLQVVQQ